MLFRLRSVLKAAKAGGTVHVVEGETVGTWRTEPTGPSNS
jgi:hypothetical protein